MKRNWTDSRDGTEWEVDAIPIIQQMEPGEPVPMIGGTRYTLWFRSSDGRSHPSVVGPEIGSRLSELADLEWSGLLDKARGGFRPH